MTSLMKGIIIVAAKRTPFGTYGGKLSDTPAIEMQRVANKAVLAATTIDPELIDTVNIGNVLTYSASDGAFLARHSSLQGGIPKKRPALLVNRLCGSGFQSLLNSCQDILTGFANISLAGGVESMSRTPYIARGLHFGQPIPHNIALEDPLRIGLYDTFCNMSLFHTVEKLGEQFKITREEVDWFALRSQHNWKTANNAGRFQEEIASIQIETKNRSEELSVDEHPRPQITLSELNKLLSPFKENGLVTAGSSSGICDGAGAIILANEQAVSRYHLRALARVIGFSTTGVDPTIMGIGSSIAIKNLLKATGKTLDDIELVEINEAFGAQTLACAKDLDLDINKLNVDGGAIALGHPLAATGIRITSHLVHELRRRKAKYGIGSTCIGGGQGIAVLIEAL